MPQPMDLPRERVGLRSLDTLIRTTMSRRFAKAQGRRMTWHTISLGRDAREIFMVKRQYFGRQARC